MIMINKAIRAQGVIWKSCSSCGVNWPFCTSGVATEFLCQVCLESVHATEMRRLEEIIASSLSARG